MNAPINDLYDISVSGKITLSAAALAVPVFKRIYDALPREESYKWINYIIYMHNWRSPYAIYLDESVRKEKILNSLFPTTGLATKAPDVVATSELEYSRELQTNEVLQLLDAARKGIHYMTDAFNNLKQNNTNPNDVVKWTKELGAMAISLDTIEKKVKANEMSGVKVRGDREVKALETPGI